MSEEAEESNVKVALGLVLAAGASTGLGAAVVFFPSLVKLASKRVLASSLGFAAGVMTYVSFVEILRKSTLSFEDAGHDPDLAYVYSTLCFFAGVLAMMILNVIVAVLLGGGHGHSHDHPDDVAGAHHHAKHLEEPPSHNPKSMPHMHSDVSESDIQCPCCSKDPVGQFDRLQAMALVLEEEQKEAEEHDHHHAEINHEISEAQAEEHDHRHAEISHEITGAPEGLDHIGGNTENDKHQELTSDDKHHDTNTAMPPATSNADGESTPEDHDKSKAEEETTKGDKKLIQMGINTAVAIGLHNFPEGLATFVAALNDKRVGAILAFAIAIHNIPEGLCVALPIYYATGNRRNAFLWALLSGFSEFVAALLGWAVLANSFSDDLFAVLFGMVAGMMVVISFRELLPTAHIYDPEDTVVTYSFVGGMALIACSLILFLL